MKSRYSIWGACIDCFERVLKINPNSAKAWHNVGIAYGKYEEDFEKAFECIKKATEINPYYINTWYTLGVVYEKIRGDEENAQICFDKVRQLKGE